MEQTIGFGFGFFPNMMFVLVLVLLISLIIRKKIIWIRQCDEPQIINKMKIEMAD